MREIKFRAKDIENNKWIYGDYTDQRFDEPSIWDDGYRIEVNPNTVGQFISLKDKNGVEVFEGDQFSIGVDKYNYYLKGSGRNKSYEPKFSHKEQQIFTVKYNVDGFYKGSYTLVNEEKHESIYKVEKLEVIGNVHDGIN